MINKPPPFEGLDIRIPILIPIKGRGFMNQGSGLTTKPKLATRLDLNSMTTCRLTWPTSMYVCMSVSMYAI